MLMSRLSLWNFSLFSIKQSSSLLQYGKPEILYNNVIGVVLILIYGISPMARPSLVVQVRCSAGACKVIKFVVFEAYNVRPIV